MGGEIDTNAIGKYIEQRMAQKMDALKDDVRQMLVGLQVDLMRQFEIQKGSV